MKTATKAAIILLVVAGNQSPVSEKINDAVQAGMTTLTFAIGVASLTEKPKAKLLPFKGLSGEEEPVRPAVTVSPCFKLPQSNTLQLDINLNCLQPPLTSLSSTQHRQRRPPAPAPAPSTSTIGSCSSTVNDAIGSYSNIVDEP